MKIGVLMPELGKRETGYGKNSFGILQGLIQNNVKIDNASPLQLVVGFAEWLNDPGLTGDRCWLYTMSESTKVSQRWVDIINSRAERVLVPCPDLVQIYQDSGVTKPVHFVGHGTDMSMPQYVPRQWNISSTEPFRFLAYTTGGVDARKGLEHSIYNFRRLSKGVQGFQLVIKVSQDKSESGWVDKVHESNIEFVKGFTSEREWHKLLASCHCFLYPSCAEGWGMTPREATLSGLPTIATEWLGMWDVAEWGYPIKVRRLQHSVYENYDKANGEGGMWSQADDDHMLEQMFSVVKDYTHALRRAQLGRDYLKMWSYYNLGTRIRNLLEQYA